MAGMHLKKQQLPHLSQQRGRRVREAAQTMLVVKIQQPRQSPSCNLVSTPLLVLTY